MLRSIPCGNSSLAPPLFRRTTLPPSSLGFTKRSRRRLSPPNASMEKEETQVEIDREKAREALQKLDQQLQGLSQQESPPRKRPPPAVSEPNLDRDMITGRRMEEMPAISGSYVAYTAVALVVLTIFNNIMFNLFVKPSVDGKEQIVKIERVPLVEPGEQ
ncbi:uncharacterized protein [Typha latifolia]|uniref:uncharacterized protein n=1 Tax=Typha latifolia TaxID=4733 RepID=UPI003C2C1842